MCKGPIFDVRLSNLTKIGQAVASMERRDIVLVPHLNGPLLGDKILLSAAFQWIRHSFPQVQIWSMDDGRCTFPMAAFGTPPNRVVSGQVQSDHPIFQDERIGLVLTFSDHNSDEFCLTGTPYHWRHVSSSLWQVLRELASLEIFPILKSPSSGFSIKPLGLKQPEYFLMHLRQLPREPSKNSDIKSMLDFAVDLSSALSADAVIVGRGDPRDRVSAPGVVDLLTEQELPWEDTIRLFHGARFFVRTGLGTAPSCRCSRPSHCLR